MVAWAAFTSAPLIVLAARRRSRTLLPIRSGEVATRSELLCQACASRTVIDAAMIWLRPGIAIGRMSRPAASSAARTASLTAGSASRGSSPTVRTAVPAMVNPGSSRAIPATRPATSLAIGPTVSRPGDSGRTPLVGMRPHVVLRPAMPQQAAGMRIDPPVSVPKAMSASPAATAVAEPLDDPPGTRRGSSGLTGVPNAPLTPLIP